MVKSCLFFKRSEGQGQLATLFAPPNPHKKIIRNAAITRKIDDNA